MKRTKNLSAADSNDRGVAQLSLLEHSLCPLDVRTSLTPGLTHQARYRYTAANGERQTATAQLHLPHGLSANDEFTLWGLLALSLRESTTDAHFAATPHFCLRQLGVIDQHTRRGGKNYRLFRQTLKRLAAATYENDAFYDPIRQEHSSVAFGFLSYRLPHSTTSERLWHFYWDPVFFEFCAAARGSLMFDLNIYRQLNPAARRLFLLLHKVFYRGAVSPQFVARDLAVQTLGFAESLSNAVIDRKLQLVIQQLTEAGIISQVSATNQRRQTILRFRRGAHFQKQREGRSRRCTATSPLTDVLVSLGFTLPDAGHLVARYDAALLREWIDITIAARERFGPDHFRSGAKAFLSHHLSKAARGEYSPPDWWHEIRKRERDSGGDRQVLNRLLRSASSDAAAQGSSSTPVRIGDLLKPVTAS